MTSSEFAWLLKAHGKTGDAKSLLELAIELEERGNFRLAATAMDRAFGLDPANTEIRDTRSAILDRLALTEHGLRFRYVPAGTFLMGCQDGEPDEQPVHPIQLGEYWLTETPVSWAAFCDLMNWEPPPYGRPKGEGTHFQGSLSSDEAGGMSFLLEDNKIRLQYCEDATVAARDWHSHAPEHNWTKGGTREAVSSRTLFGSPDREDPRRPWRYDRKPMIAVSWETAEALCRSVSNQNTFYGLPTEAEWEKGARGGLTQCRFPWGDESARDDRCDFDRFDSFSILPMRRFAPNDYGIYAMSGGVWEWVSDWYDSEYYRNCEPVDPQGPKEGNEKALRGGSWSDCAEAVNVSFRMSRDRAGTPNVGFRICRKEPSVGD